MYTNYVMVLLGLCGVAQAQKVYTVLPKQNLIAALQKIPAGSTVWLLGQYHIPSTLMLGKTLYFKSQPEKTTLNFSAATRGIHIQGSKTQISFDNIRIVSSAKVSQNLIQLQSGSLTLRRSVVSGAVNKQASGNMYGNGIDALGGTVVLEDSRFEFNHNAGLALRKNSKATVQGGKFKFGMMGILLQDSAVLDIRNTEASANDRGIHAQGQARAVLNNTWLRGNDSAGVSFAAKSTGVLSNNRIEFNKKAGIEVNQDATVDIKSNSITQNLVTGIDYGDHGAGTAEKNTIANNGYFGISVAGESKPNLFGNTISEQVEGIRYTKHASGLARDNIIRSQKNNGILLEMNSNPQLQNNTIENNVAAGLSYNDQASGKAIKNTIRMNNIGIQLEDQAKPELVENIVENNQQGNQSRDIFRLETWMQHLYGMWFAMLYILR